MTRYGLLGSARQMRKAPTEAERVLWQALRRKSIAGLRFRRQRIIGSYIVDFCCLQTNLIVEVDGEHHRQEETAAYDEARTDFLQTHGFHVLRFTNEQVLTRLETVLETIAATIPEPPQSPRPPCP